MKKLIVIALAGMLGGCVVAPMRPYAYVQPLAPVMYVEPAPVVVFPFAGFHYWRHR